MYELGYGFSSYVYVCVYACEHALSDGYGLSFRVNFIFFLIWLNIVWLEAVVFWGLLVTFSAEHPLVTEPVSKGYLSGKRKWWLTLPPEVWSYPFIAILRSQCTETEVWERKTSELFSTLFFTSFIEPHVTREEYRRHSVIALEIGKMY